MPRVCPAKRAGRWCKSGRLPPKEIASEQQAESIFAIKLCRARPIQRRHIFCVRKADASCINLGGTANSLRPKG